MKVLLVSNLYPPHYLGGYEVRCAQTATELQRRGHEVQVLTSSYGVVTSRLRTGRRKVETVDGVCVHRALGQYAYGPQTLLRPWTLAHARMELADARYFVDLLDDFKPDIANW